MKSRSAFVAAVAVLLACTAGAAPLAPHQQHALRKMLENVPAEQRALVRPQLEAALAEMTREQVGAMLAGAGAEGGGEDLPSAAASAAQAARSAEWGAAEAEFEKAFASAQAYQLRISDARDAARARWEGRLHRLKEELLRSQQGGFPESSAVDGCERELDELPVGRRASKSLTTLLAEQDRVHLRQVVEFRARHGSFEQMARALGQPASSPTVQGFRAYFGDPQGEGEVIAKLAAVETGVVELIGRSSAERLRIDRTPYPDDGHGSLGRMRQRDLDALGVRTGQAAQALCRQGREAYYRGLAAIVAPLVPKVRAHLGR